MYGGAKKSPLQIFGIILIVVAVVLLAIYLVISLGIIPNNLKNEAVNQIQEGQVQPQPVAEQPVEQATA